jgi:hypothetical protein
MATMLETTVNGNIVKGTMSKSLFDACQTFFKSNVAYSETAFKQHIGRENEAEWDAIVAERVKISKGLGVDDFDINEKYEDVIANYTSETPEEKSTNQTAAIPTEKLATYYKRDKDNKITSELTNRTVKLAEAKNVKTKEILVPKALNTFKYKVSDDDVVEVKHIGKITAFKLATRLASGGTNDKGYKKGSVSEFVKTANGFDENKAYGALGDNYSVSFQVLSPTGEIYNSEVEEGSALDWITLRLDQILSSEPVGKNKVLALQMQRICVEPNDWIKDKDATAIDIFKNVMDAMVEMGVNTIFETSDENPVYVKMACEERIANKTQWYENLANVQLPADSQLSDFITDKRPNQRGVMEDVILCYHKNTGFSATKLEVINSTTAKASWANQEKLIGKAENKTDFMDTVEKARKKGYSMADAITLAKAMLNM